MMNNIQQSEAMMDLKDWALVGSFTVGGFDYMGFSISDSNKLIIIADRETVFDCRDGSITDVGAVLDESEFVAMVNVLPDEFIPIAGAFGGEIPHSTVQGDKVEISYYGDHVISGKKLKYQKIVFIDRYGNEKIIHDNYPSYVCGFSKDGNSFALADDGALRVLRRSEVSGPGAGI